MSSTAWCPAAQQGRRALWAVRPARSSRSVVPCLPPLKSPNVVRPQTRLAVRACGALPCSRAPPGDPLARSEGLSVLRTHTAGSLRAEHIGHTVTLTGWVDRRRDHGGVAFIDLRDASGIAQVVIRDEEVAHPLRTEYVLQVTGEVVAGPPATRTRTSRPARSSSWRATSSCSTSPRRCRSRSPRRCNETVGEEARLKYRYLDLRRPARRARCACAPRPTRPRGGCSTRRTSSRSRRRP